MKIEAWLDREMPDWIARGWLTPAAAVALRAQYAAPDRRARGARIFGALAAALIGLGLILLLAHNWPDLTRPLRTALALLPLLAAQAGCAWARRPTGRADTGAREGWSLFLALMIGLSIALIGQTYHVPGNLASFLGVWMLLALPVIYVMRARLPAFLYLAGVTAWTIHARAADGTPQAYLLWLLPLLPGGYALARDPAAGGWRTAAALAVAASLTLTTGFVLERILPGLWMLVYGSLFAVLYFIGRHAERALARAASLGIAGLALLLTFDWPWRKIGWARFRPAETWLAGLDYALFAALGVAAVAGLARAARRGRWADAYWGSLPAALALGYGAAGGKWGAAGFAQALCNGWLAVAGLVWLAHGLRRNEPGAAHGGVALLSLLILARFFDEHIGFVARGLAFIGAGAAFLMVHFALARRARGNGHE